MAGKNDRIHGYNPIYRSEQPVKFHSFDMEKNGPSKFINRLVTIEDSSNKILDHQGHIVPQNMLDSVLNPLMKEMAKCNDIAQVENFINGSPWMKLVYDYGKKINAPIFDFDQKEPEDKVGNFFAIVTWNPVNLCRAPKDDERGKRPGQNVDIEVRDYLDNHSKDQGVNTDWLSSLKTLNQNETDKNKIEKYITQCCNTLSGQLKEGIGYYSFPWKYNAKKELIPS